MSATQTIFDSYSRPHSLDASQDLVALPSFGAVLTRIKTAFSNWAQASVQAEAESRLWDSAQADPRIMAELVQARVRQEPATSPADFTRAPLATASDRLHLNDGWGSVLEHAYKTRFHSNGSQIA